LSDAFGQRDRRRNGFQSLAGKWFHDPLLHEAFNPLLQSQIPGRQRHDFAHRPAVIGYHHFFALLNEL
jgi:hypothetical protein